jgi:aconitate decarboxylase
MLNSSFIQGIELDDYHPAALHSNSLILPAILAAAPHAGQVSEARFLPGAILGYETGPRVGQALGGLDMISWGLAFGRGVRHPACRRVHGSPLQAGRPAGFEEPLGWTPPSPAA